MWSVYTLFQSYETKLTFWLQTISEQNAEAESLLQLTQTNGTYTLNYGDKEWLENFR